MTRLRQVLSNLVSNAVKFTSNGSVMLTVSQLDPVGTEDARLRFCVTDTGSGIPEKHQSRVFGRFEQLPSEVHALVHLLLLCCSCRLGRQ